MLETASSERVRRFSVGRVLLLTITGVCLYLLAPSIVEVFAAWDRLGEFHPVVVLGIIACEALSFLCVWILQRIALRTKDWFRVVTTQLAGNAFSRVTPGGGATGTAIQARMLADGGFGLTTAAYGLTVQSMMITGAVVALPVFSIPAIAAGLDVPGGLREAAWIGLAVFVVMAGVGALMLVSRRPVEALARVITWVGRHIRPSAPPIEGLGARLLAERDEIRATMGSRWPTAVGAAIGRWGFEYVALLLALYAIDARPDPALVLLAFAAGSALSLIPFTPGGLGFVEAGLAGSLGLAGIDIGDAVLVTLVFRLVSFWLPMPIGLGAALVYRRRYPRRPTAPKGRVPS